jgi:hypothetical protein
MIASILPWLIVLLAAAIAWFLYPQHSTNHFPVHVPGTTVLGNLDELVKEGTLKSLHKWTKFGPVVVRMGDSPS